MPLRETRRHDTEVSLNRQSTQAPRASSDANTRKTSSTSSRTRQTQATPPRGTVLYILVDQFAFPTIKVHIFVVVKIAYYAKWCSQLQGEGRVTSATSATKPPAAAVL
jgi:hypothetical protein